MSINELLKAMEIYHKNFQLTNCTSQAKVEVQIKMKFSVQQVNIVCILYELMQKLSQENDTNDKQ